MKGLIKRILISLLVCLLVLPSTIVAFAADSATVKATYNKLSDDDKAKITFSGDSVSVNGANIACSSSSGQGLAPITLGSNTFYMTQDQINELDTALNNFATASEKLKNDNGAAGAKNKVGELEKQFDVGADMKSAGTAMSGFKAPIATVIGIILYLVVTLFGLVTALDIAYIVIPFIRILCDEKGQFGGLSGKTSDGQTKFKFISDEAVYAVKQNTIENGKNPLGTYIMKRIFGVIMLGIAIFMLATNNLSLLMKISLNVVSGVIDLLVTMAG